MPWWGLPQERNPQVPWKCWCARLYCVCTFVVCCMQALICFVHAGVDCVCACGSIACPHFDPLACSLQPCTPASLCHVRVSLSRGRLLRVLLCVVQVPCPNALSHKGLNHDKQVFNTDRGSPSHLRRYTFWGKLAGVWQFVLFRDATLVVEWGLCAYSPGVTCVRAIVFCCLGRYGHSAWHAGCC